MIKKLTDAEKAQMHDQLWRTIAKNQETITEQGTLVAQLSDELAAMTKTLDKAGDMLELMTKTATENREAYEAETLSTLEMAKKITELEGCLRTEAMRIENLKSDRDEWKRKCLRNQSQRDEWKASVKELEAESTRLHSHWHAAEERAKVAEARLKDRDERLCKLSNAASVLWEEHKAFGEDVHDTEGVDFLGSDSEGHAMMQALVDETLAAVDSRHNVPAMASADNQTPKSNGTH